MGALWGAGRWGIGVVGAALRGWLEVGYRFCQQYMRKIGMRLHHIRRLILQLTSLRSCELRVGMTVAKNQSSRLDYT